jgi:hypothetical protein
MQLILAAGTTQAHLDGTTTGIVVMVILAFLALILFISLIFWADRAPRSRPPGQSQGLARRSDRDR